MMHGREKSRSAIVAGKPTNKAERSAAELVEPRAETKGNVGQQSTRRTQSRISVSKRWLAYGKSLPSIPEVVVPVVMIPPVRGEGDRSPSDRRDGAHTNSTLFDPPLMTRAFGGHLPTTDTRSLAAQTDAGLVDNCLRKPGWKGTHNTALSRTTGHRDYSAGHRGHRPKATARAVLTRPSW